VESLIRKPFLSRADELFAKANACLKWLSNGDILPNVFLVIKLQVGDAVIYVIGDTNMNIG
jgi:hypothetical protein